MSHINRDRLNVTVGDAWRLYQLTALPGWEMLGTVQRGLEIGALAKSAAGVYAQINSGAVRSLDQRKVIAALELKRTAC
jgi:hypothetical protein